MTIHIRPATELEQSTLRGIISAAHLDPTNLHWPNFVVAEWDGQLAGIAQIKPHTDCREFGSLVVLPAYRKRGIAAQLIEHCLANESKNIYLLCRDNMESFYMRWGFQRIPCAEAPPTLRIKLAAATVMRVIGIRIISMRRDPH